MVETIQEDEREIAFHPAGNRRIGFAEFIYQVLSGGMEIGSAIGFQAFAVQAHDRLQGLGSPGGQIPSGFPDRFRHFLGQGLLRMQLIPCTNGFFHHARGVGLTGGLEGVGESKGLLGTANQPALAHAETAQMRGQLRKRNDTGKQTGPFSSVGQGLLQSPSPSGGWNHNPGFLARIRQFFPPHGDGEILFAIPRKTIPFRFG